MSGPDLPRPIPGSNSIGKFIIGVSKIGDIPVFDYWSTVLSQYANSPILTQLISNFNAYIDPTKELSDFFDLWWDIDTAQGAGLDRIGRVLGVQRVLQIPLGVFFGFSGPSGASGAPFNVQSFSSGPAINSNFALSDNSFRVLLFAKALANISDGSVSSINQLLLNLFPHRGNCYVTDGLDMTMTYTFSFSLSSVELAIIGQSGVLPKPAGVQSSVIHP